MGHHQRRRIRPRGVFVLPRWLRDVVMTARRAPPLRASHVQSILVFSDERVLNRARFVSRGSH